MVNGANRIGDAISQFSGYLRREPHQFLQPRLEQQQAAVAAAKAIVDPLAQQVAQAQTARRNENRRKRKRGSDQVEDPVLQLRQIYTNGLAVKQVWEQARRVLDAACNEVERSLDEYLDKHELQDERMLQALDPESDSDAHMTEGEESVEDEGEDIVSEENIAEDILNDEDDIEDIEDDEGVPLDDREEGEFDEAPQATYKPDPNNLNDGFFSIDDFNKQSQFLEQMDARGDEDNPSDEDEIDFDADPLAQPLPKSKLPSGRSSRQRDEPSEEEGDEGGPTFGNADLNAPDSDEESGAEVDEGELDGMMSGLVNTNDVRYADFFEPPPKKPSKSKRTRALPKTQPPPEPSRYKAQHVEEADVDLERAMADVRRDLLDSDDEAEEAEENEEEADLSSDNDGLPRPSTLKTRDKNLSTHERQKLEIASEIRRLEALNVSKKPWTLSGEASAGARPLNSLIEEDLDFERTGKPVPVITAEVSTDIEALIKRRILARDFDEVVRRHPTASDARRGRADVIVDDTKPTSGLGEIYETEYQRTADPASFVDKRSVATKKQHDEISKLWREVRDQLDVLANLHIKPKRAEIEIRTVEDKPRIAMEDAQPAASGIDEGGTMLAPQEIYKPGVDSRADKAEVLGRSGAARAREEMTREEKVRKRRREKERIKKAGGSGDKKGGVDGKNKKPSRKEEQDKVLRDLQKGGAKVIGKDGQLQELSGKKGRGPRDADPLPTSGGSLKL